MEPELCFPLKLEMTHFVGRKWSWHIIDANGRKVGQLANVLRQDAHLIEFMLSEPRVTQLAVDILMKEQGWKETTAESLPDA